MGLLSSDLACWILSWKEAISIYDAAERGITREQLLKLVGFISKMADKWCETYGQDCGKELQYETFNLYHANHWLIKPATEGYNDNGCSLVEIMALQVQRPHWFVSHAWVEPRPRDTKFNIKFLPLFGLRLLPVVPQKAVVEVSKIHFYTVEATQSLQAFSRMRSEGSCFIWGSGGEAVFAESCVGVRNRSQPSATVRNRPQPSATVCVSAISSPQWRVRQEWSWKCVKLTRVVAVVLVSAEEVSVWVICVAAVILVSAEEMSVWVICVAADILVFAEEVSVWVICVAAFILAFAEELSVCLICVVALILVSAEEVSVRAICVTAVTLAFAEELSVWVICVAALLLAFAEAVSVWVSCVAAVILVFAEEVYVWAICVAAFISAFAEELSVWVICVAAVILAFAEAVSVWVICVAAVILVFAEDVSVWVVCVAAIILAFAEEAWVWVICVAAVILVLGEAVSVWVICVK